MKNPSALLLLITLPVAAQVSVLTQHNDNQRTGANLKETILNPGNVYAGGFGMLFKRTVDDQVYAQPLYVPGVDLAGAIHNVVYIATVNNSVYAFDADDAAAGEPYWQVNFGVPPSLASARFSCSDMTGNMGIIGTPVIDPDSQTLYVVSVALEETAYVQRLHALDLATGEEKLGGPVEISTPGFIPLMHNQRPGLLLVNGNVYIAYASHCDDGKYHGFVFAYNAASLSQIAFFNTSKSGRAAGIWQSGQGLSSDSDGNIFFVTGNGDWDGVSNFSESFIKLSGSDLTLLDWFTPSNQADLDRVDNDLGTSGAMLIPGTDLFLGAGKTGVMYVLYTNYLGNLGDVQAVQKFQASGRHVHSMVTWQSAVNGRLLYIWGESDQMRVYKLTDGLLQTTPLMTGSRGATGHPGASLSVSANGDSDGILWASTMASGDAWHASQPGVLRAFDADDTGSEIWNSLENPNRDNCNNYAKFAAPTIANGKVYLASFGTQNTASGQLCVYGLLSGAPDFTLKVSPATSVVMRGGNATYNIIVRAQSGFSGNASLSVAGLPPGASATFSPNIVAAGGAAAMTVVTTKDTPFGSYALTLSATSGELRQSGVATLIVSAVTPGQGAISINFVGSGLAMGTGETAGVTPRPFWNNAFGQTSITPLTLTDETGTRTPASVIWNCNNIWSLPTTDQPGDRRMMKGYLDTSSTSTTAVTVTALSSGTYDVYVYADGDNGGSTRSATYELSGPGIETTTITLTDAAGTNFNGIFTEANNSNGNYVKFTIQGTEFTVKATPGSASDNTRRAPLNGIQIIRR